jgi:hypothetical protein
MEMSYETKKKGEKNKKKQKNKKPISKKVQKTSRLTPESPKT